jgi:hypothetical protein
LVMLVVLIWEQVLARHPCKHKYNYEIRRILQSRRR